jgi:hypothetical protein
MKNSLVLIVFQQFVCFFLFWFFFVLKNPGKMCRLSVKMRFRTDDNWTDRRKPYLGYLVETLTPSN